MLTALRCGEGPKRSRWQRHTDNRVLGSINTASSVHKPDIHAGHLLQVVALRYAYLNRQGPVSIYNVISEVCRWKA